MTFGVNTGPFAGREAKWGTSRKLRERLFDELRTNVALRVEETESAETFLVSGRGELHLGILIETMRREGYEFQVSRPEVIFHKAVDGSLLEPYEEVHIETSTETVGVVVEMLGARRGQMMDMHDTGQGTTRLTYIAPTRGLLGFRYQFLTSTRGAGVMHTVFSGYDEMAGPDRDAQLRFDRGDGSRGYDRLCARSLRKTAARCLWGRAWRCMRAWWSARTAAARISRSTSAGRST